MNSINECGGNIMNCMTCGSPLKEGAKFCANCGCAAQSLQAPSVSIPQKRKVSMVTLLMSGISLILAAALAYMLLTSTTQNISGVKLTGKTFSTPAEVLNYFVGGVKTCDMQKMSEAFAIEKSARGFNFTTYSSRLKTIIPTTFLMPNEYSQYTYFNRVQQLNQCIVMYKQIVYGVNGIDWNKTIYNIDDAYIKDYVKKLNPGSLNSIRVSKFTEFSMAKDEKHLENMKKIASAYGADEARVYGVELECSGKKVSCDLLQVLRYGSSWYIISGIFNGGGLSN